jgi:TetR/AcrR family transcriptional regulator
MATASADPDSRTAILDAATGLFARRGLEATTIKEIGREAGVTPGLLYYYFADKDALYRAVLDRAMGEFPGRLAPLAGVDGAPADALAGLIRAQAELFLAQPLLPRLIVRELADHEARHAAPVIRQHAQALLRAITALIARGQASGDFRRDVEPEFAALSTLSQLNWFCVAGPAVEQVLAREGAARDAATVRAFAEHAVRFTLAGLEARR